MMTPPPTPPMNGEAIPVTQGQAQGPAPTDRCSLARAERRTLLGIIHKGAKQLGLEDEDRRQMQWRLTGVDSGAGMTLAQLRQVAWHLKQAGADIGIPGPRPPAVRLDRVTSAQLARLEELMMAHGWTGLLDGRFVGFLKRTAKVDHWQFLTRRQATHCIAGLARWLAQKSPEAGG